MKYRWLLFSAVAASALLFGLPILLSNLGLLEISDSLRLLTVLFSWPIAVVIIGLFFMGRFHGAIDFLLRNIGSMKFPGGIEIQRQDQPSPVKDENDIEGALVSVSSESHDKLDDVLTEIRQDQKLSEVEIQQLKQQYLQVAVTAKFWKYSYLNLLFVPQTKNVLTWFARSVPQTRQSYDTLWTPYILDQNQRNTILSVLLQNGMLLEEGGQLRISEEGYAFLQFIGSVPIAPPQQGA